MEVETCKCTKCFLTQRQEQYSTEEWAKLESERKCKKCELGDRTKQKNQALLTQFTAHLQDEDQQYHRLYVAPDGTYKYTIIVKTIEDLSDMYICSVQNTNTGEWEHSKLIKAKWLRAFRTEDVDQIHAIPREGPQTEMIKALDLLAETQSKSNEAQEKLAQAISDGSKTKDPYTKLMYQSKTLGLFKAKYPKSQDSFYTWLFAVKDFQTKHGGLGCSNELLFDKILESLSTQDRTSWEQHREAEYIKYLTDEAKENNQEALEAFSKQIDKIPKLIEYTVNRFVDHPDIQWFLERLMAVRCHKNENPKDSLTRLETYIHQVESLRITINSILKTKLRKPNAIEISQILRAMFITNNANCSTPSKLNSKVRTKIAQKWVKLEQTHITSDHKLEEYVAFNTAIKKYIRDVLPESIVPALNEAHMDEEHKWKKYPQNTSIFSLSTQSGNISGSKRKRSDNSKSRYDGSQERCPFKGKCTFLKSQKGCKFFHTVSELRGKKQKTSNGNQDRKLTSIPQDCRNFLNGIDCARKPCPYNHPANPRSNKSDSRSKRTFRTKYTPRDPRLKPTNSNCRNGKSCPHWQDGNCRFKHDDRDMTCSFCNKPGHPKSKCYSNPENKSAPPQRYSLNTPNRPEIKSHNALMAQTENLTKAVTDMQNNMTQQLNSLNQRIPNLALAQNGNSTNQNMLSLKEKKKLTETLGKLGVFNS